MKYAGMPFGMWMLFAGSFQKQQTAVCAVITSDLESLKEGATHYGNSYN